jgi:Cu/Ag efflux pump CusA
MDDILILIVALFFLTAIHFGIFYVAVMFLSVQMQIMLLAAYVCSIIFMNLGVAIDACELIRKGLRFALERMHH